MVNYRRELFREVMNSATATAQTGELRDWSRLMREKEQRIFELMGKEATQRLADGNTLPTHEDRLNETIRKGMWVPPTRSST